MRQFSIRKGIKILFFIWLLLVEVLTFAGILVLGWVNEKSVVQLLSYEALFVAVYNFILFLITRNLVKEVIVLPNQVEIKRFWRKTSIIYAYESYNIRVETTSNEFEMNRSRNYYLHLKNKKSAHTKSYHIGLLTSSQKRELKDSIDLRNCQES